MSLLILPVPLGICGWVDGLNDGVCRLRLQKGLVPLSLELRSAGEHRSSPGAGGCPVVGLGFRFAAVYQYHGDRSLSETIGLKGDVGRDDCGGW